MSVQPGPMEAPERVLSTLNLDGTRRWIRPKPERGAFWRRRRITACVLTLVFILIPYIQVAGRPLVLLDLPRREFTIFGATFLPTDMLLFALLFLSAVIAVFLFSALMGRVWCGWACPQTVYMEFLFRPIERWLEGGYRGSQLMDQKRGLHPRRLLKYLIYLVLAAALAHIFLAYFVGVKELAKWVTRSPIEHPTSFFVMLGTTALIFFDFAYFREQTCLVACPYGRIQSVLLDRQSLIVGYDPNRGEPRGKGIRDRAPGMGDCIECRRCVMTCPTGIDIREGLQMECIHCTQCMDACDAVMTKIGKPVGLIRYTSRAELEHRPRRMLRPRVLMYPAVLAATLGLFGFTLATRSDTEVTVLRAGGQPYVREGDGTVVNQILVKITNRGARDRSYHIGLASEAGLTLVVPQNPVPVPAGEVRTTTVFAVIPAHNGHGREIPVRFLVTDGDHFSTQVPYRVLAPEHEEEEHHGPDDARKSAPGDSHDSGHDAGRGAGHGPSGGGH
ncbi:MAG: cytochrome c oxidase accessory protein CcoG [Candidatus Eisenbacteria bacterium]|nr:cytochrome c oxidase accessory protein CcoG [Candidatus Eisenbacteria bacterium]